jgi:cation transport ATPase
MSRTPAPSPLLGTNRVQGLIAVLALAAIVVHLLLRFAVGPTFQTAIRSANWPLLLALILGGGPLLWGLAVKLVHGEFGSDLLAGLSIATSIMLGEYLAGTVVVLMLAGGEALEGFAVRRASFALEGLARRLPALAHRRGEGKTEDVALDEVHVGDHVVIFPHEACPVDGTVRSRATASWMSSTLLGSRT